MTKIQNGSAEQTPGAQYDASEWPRDFDFRIEYAEQAELISDDEKFLTATKSDS